MDWTKGSLKKEQEYHDPPMGVNYVIMGQESVTHEQTHTPYLEAEAMAGHWQSESDVLSAGEKREKRGTNQDDKLFSLLSAMGTHRMHTFTHSRQVCMFTVHTVLRPSSFE